MKQASHKFDRCLSKPVQLLVDMLQFGGYLSITVGTEQPVAIGLSKDYYSGDSVVDDDDDLNPDAVVDELTKPLKSLSTFTHQQQQLFFQLVAHDKGIQKRVDAARAQAVNEPELMTKAFNDIIAKLPGNPITATAAIESKSSTSNSLEWFSNSPLGRLSRVVGPSMCCLTRVNGARWYEVDAQAAAKTQAVKEELSGEELAHLLKQYAALADKLQE